MFSKCLTSKFRRVLFFLFILFLSQCHTRQHHPLRVSDVNPRYFTDGTGNIIYLTGSHTWNNLLDMTHNTGPGKFDYPAYLAFLKEHHHNFFRLWTWELLNWDTHANQDENSKDYSVDPHPWLRTGPGTATDGKPKFDCTKFNEEYFKRLHERVEAAREMGIYVSIMVFEGWGIQFSPEAYKNHPFYSLNNINDLGLDTAYASRLEIHELKNKKVLNIQENYVRELVKSVNDLDNVLYEISNENHPASTEWQYHIIRLIKDYENVLGNRHPVGMTFQYRGGTNQALFDSPADWISPNPEGGYRDDPPPSDGRKVIINDTDHLWGLGGNPGWVWKSFLQGMNVLFMDPYDGKVLMETFDQNWAESIRKNMGYAREFADTMALANMVPSGELCSSGYCLACRGKEYLVYNPRDSVINVNLQGVSGNFKIQWLNPSTGEKIAGSVIEGGSAVSLTPPFHSEFSILYLKAG